jgi:hypothetical protein
VGGTAYLTPATFGYGPAALAVAVARALAQHDPRLRVVGVGDGAVLDYLRRSRRFDAVVSTPAGEWSIETQTRSVVLSFGDFDRAIAAHNGGAPVIVVDPLYWMWDADPLDPSTVAAYLCPAFPGLEQRLQQRAGAARAVPQIVDAQAPGANRPRAGAIVNLGGAISPHGGNYGYLQALVAVAREALGARDVVVACSPEAADAVRATPLPPATRIASLPADAMMRALRDRALLVTVPGQSIVWEALQAGIPTVMLPGANYSQHRQAVAYRRVLASSPILTWDDLPGYATLPPGMAETDGVAGAIALGERFRGDAAARRALVAALAEVLREPVPALAPVGRHPWSSLDGAAVVAREALAVLRRAAPVRGDAGGGLRSGVAGGR